MSGKDVLPGVVIEVDLIAFGSHEAGRRRGTARFRFFRRGFVSAKRRAPTGAHALIKQERSPGAAEYSNCRRQLAPESRVGNRSPRFLKE